MSTSQILTDEQAAAIWSGDPSLLNFNENQPPAATPLEEETQDEPAKLTGPIDDDAITNVFATADDEDDEDESEPVVPPVTQRTDAEPKKSGRKPADLVVLVNQLVEEGELVGFDDGEIKTIDEAKELIRENLKHKEESSEDSFWLKKVQKYSPQVQAILHYAEKGGEDITPLLSAIAEVEKSSDINIEEESGQEEIVRQVLKIKGFDEDEITDQIETLKDLDKLKAKAGKFLPELNRMKEQRIQMIMQEQEVRQRQAEEAASAYVQTIQSTLDKDQVGSLKLNREDKYKIMDALAVPKYKSINGYQVNEFVKALEEMQFGKNADYEHFLNLVHFAIDKDGFMEKLTEIVQTSVSADTVRKLKTAKNSSPNSSNEPVPSNGARKNTIQRGGFKNPYSK